MIKFLSEPDAKIITMGMSCVGKTTFAKALVGHHYYCFDALFEWHMIETFGLSITANLQQLSKICTEDSYVLDGWHLADRDGLYFPDGTVPYVIYASYEHIIDQYRIPVGDRDEFRPMFNKWYHEIEYPRLRSRYFANEGIFVETNERAFTSFLEQNR